MVAKAFQTYIDVVIPYTVKRIFSSRVAFNHAKIH
jgi:hypothetical protein